MVQEEIAKVANAAKNSKGDKVLVNIALQEKVTPVVQTLLEKSPRASVKAAWLSREGHPIGYVESCIRKEKRVSVLAAVAGHKDSPQALLDALSDMDLIGVAAELLMRDDLSDYSLLNIFKTIVPAEKNSYKLHRKLKEIIKTNPTMHSKLIDRAQNKQELVFIMSVSGCVLPAKDLKRASKVILKGALEQIPDEFPSSYGRYHHNSMLTSLIDNISLLLSQPNWEEGSEEDMEVSKVLNKIKPSEISFRFSEHSKNCLTRHYGTDSEKAEFQIRREELLQNIENAAVTTNSAEITSYLNYANSAIIESLSRNENVKLEHFEKVNSYNAYLLYNLVDKGQSLVDAATILLQSGAQEDETLYERLTNSQWEEVAGKAFVNLKATLQGNITPYSMRYLFKNEHAVRGAISQFSLEEIALVLDYDYTDIKLKKQITTLITEILLNKLKDEKSWKSFFALAPQMECSITESLEVALSI